MQTDLYADLYKNAEIDTNACNTLLNDVNVKLTEEECELCESDIAIQEVEIVINSLKRDSSPGYDGILNEFYQKYWPVIGLEFVNVINEIQNSGNMSNSQSLGIITLLYKKGDRNDITNWRPITLLNCDYKIIEKVLANRMKFVLNNIIHSDQKAYIKGRQISENIRLAHDVTFYCENHNKPGAILYIDQSKAFDRVSHKWLEKVLKRYGFGNNFQKWIRILYAGAKSTIFTNVFFSQTINIERGYVKVLHLGRIFTSNKVNHWPIRLEEIQQ